MATAVKADVDKPDVVKPDAVKPEAVGERVKALREASGLSLRDLSERRLKSQLPTLRKLSLPARSFAASRRSVRTLSAFRGRTLRAAA